MAYTTNAASNKVPAFGIPGIVTVGATAKDWDITNLDVTPGTDLVEHRDAYGNIASRSHYNLASTAATAANKSTTISITAIPVKNTRANAVLEAVNIANGTVFTVPGADGLAGSESWECTGFSQSNTNTEVKTVTLNGALLCGATQVQTA